MRTPEGTEVTIDPDSLCIERNTMEHGEAPFDELPGIRERAHSRFMAQARKELDSFPDGDITLDGSSIGHGTIAAVRENSQQ